MMAATVTGAPNASQVLQTVAGLPPPVPSFPALQPVESRQQYRERPETETEEAVWYSVDEPDTLVQPEQVRLRSIHSKKATVIVFVNASSYRCRALWVDFKGNEVAYSILEPGTTKRYHTYVTHPWIVRELHSATRMLLSGQPSVVGAGTEQTVQIQGPPLLKWDMAAHACFPEAYKASVRGLLLSHKALEPYAVATGGPASPDVVLSRGALHSPRKRAALSVMPVHHDQLNVSTPRHLAAPASQHASLYKHAAPSAALPPLSPAGPKVYTTAADGNMAIITGKELPQSADDSVFTSTTSISFSSEAAHFTATLTVSSPRRAAMKSSVNIELAGGSNRAIVNFDTVMTDACTASRAQPPAASKQQLVVDEQSHVGGLQEHGKKQHRGLFSMLRLCSSPVTASPRNMLKNLLSRPSASTSSCGAASEVSFNATVTSPRKTQSSANASLALDVKLKPVHTGTSLKVQVHQQEDALVDDVKPLDTCWPPRDTHLGNLPSHIVVYIAELAAPVTWQSLSAPALGRPDIKATMMACPPITAEEQQQLEEQEQQQNAQQNNAGQ